MLTSLASCEICRSSEGMESPSPSPPLSEEALLQLSMFQRKCLKRKLSRLSGQRAHCKNGDDVGGLPLGPNSCPGFQHCGSGQARAVSVCGFAGFCSLHCAGKTPCRSCIAFVVRRYSFWIGVRVGLPTAHLPMCAGASAAMPSDRGPSRQPARRVSAACPRPCPLPCRAGAPKNPPRFPRWRGLLRETKRPSSSPTSWTGGE